MSEIDESDVSPGHDTGTDISDEELTAKVETFRDGLASAWAEIDGLKEHLEEEREARQRLEEANESLQEEIARLDARTDLLRLVESSDDMDAKQRRVALIQHLKQAAERNRSRDRDAKASVNRNEAEAALQYPDINRTTIYDDLRKAPGLVQDEDVLWYESSSGGNSRLKLDLENCDLPGEIVGKRGRYGDG